MTVTKEHLAVFDIYEKKEEPLHRIGTKEGKLLFQEGEFEKITDLIRTNYLWRTTQLGKIKTDNYEKELDILAQIRWNKKRIKCLSINYCNPKKEKSLFSDIMDILWVAFGWEKRLRRTIHI